MRLRAYPATEALLRRPGTVERLTRAQGRYLRLLFAAPLDGAHARDLVRIGLVHHRLGLVPQWYIATYAHFICDHLQAFARDGRNPDPALTAALVRSVFYDIGLVLDAYGAGESMVRRARLTEIVGAAQPAASHVEATGAAGAQPTAAPSLTRVHLTPGEVEERAEALMRTDGFAAELLASAPSAVAIVSPTRRILSANRAMLELFPGDPGLLYRMRAEDAIPMPEVRSVLDRVARSEVPRSVTFGRFARRQVKVTAYRLAQRPDLPEGAIALLLDDFTGLLRAADEADLDGRRLLEVLDSSGAVLWEMDPGPLTVLAVSSAVFALTGRRDVWFVGRTDAWLERTAAPDRERLRRFLRGLGDGERRAIDYRLDQPEGAARWVRSHVTRHHPPGQQGATLRAVTIDIDADRRAQQHRLQSASVLAGGVAHVINNSLMAIGGALEMLARRSSGDAVGFAALVQDALVEIASAKGLTSKVLAFAGRQALQPEVVSLDAVVRQSFAVDASAGGRLEVECDAGIWPVNVDALRFSTALWCLVANAREAMPGGGTTRVHIRNCSGADLEPTDVGVGSDWVEVEVIDQGPGMSAEVRRRAVEPFFSTKDADAGHHGLGLRVAFGFAVQSGGYLAIEASEGGGCTVRLRLPRHLPVPAVTPRPVPQRARILLVEDHALVRRVVAALLQDFGYDVLPVGSAAEAIERRACDLFLSDVRLGRSLDGVDLAIQVRQRLPRIAVMLMSGYSAELLDLSRLPSHYRFLEKPFTPEQLQREVSAALAPPRVTRP